MKKAVIYTRVSTGKKSQLQSYDNQREHYTNWCARNNYKLVHIYPEKGLSGTNARRPQFKQMLEDSGVLWRPNDKGVDYFERIDEKQPDFNYIIVKDPSRFSRNSIVGMQVLQLLRDKGVYVIFENAGASTEESNWKRYLEMLFSMAEAESENISKRIRFAKKLNADKQLYKPARLPYGYTKDQDGNIIIDKEQAKIVRFIYDNYVEQGSHVLSKRLNEDNIPTQQGAKWSNDKIGRIIRNSIYYGEASAGRSMKRNVTDIYRIDIPKDKWIPIPNAVPPIVTKQEWENVNKIRESRINRSGKRGRRPSTNDPYFEKIYCESCGSRFVRHIGHNDKITYMCQNRRKAQGCKVRGISINNIEKLVEQININQIINSMGSHGYYTVLTKRIESETRLLQKRRADITTQIVELNKDHKNWLNALSTKLKDSPKSVIESITDEMAEIKDTVKDLEAQREGINIEALQAIKYKVEEKKKLIDIVNSSKKLNKQAKRNLLKRITVGDYQCSLEFLLPTFEDEVNEFNELYIQAPIETELEFRPFIKTYRREHKEARSYWKIVDEEAIDQQDYFRDNPTFK
ncbi:hypothetical protein ACA30_05945 [Virgibacillus soli]|nr:hypothetical protein ACA30_05945 [Virgibacillus soli]